jgi:hypothetical protein
MTITHTRGPWRFCDVRADIVSPDSEPVARLSFHGANSMAQSDANGRLIAAAPELLRVARLALAELDALRLEAMTCTHELRADLARVIAAATSASDTTTTEHPGA